MIAQLRRNEMFKGGEREKRERGQVEGKRTTSLNPHFPMLNDLLCPFLCPFLCTFFSLFTGHSKGHNGSVAEGTSCLWMRHNDKLCGRPDSVLAVQLPLKQWEQQQLQHGGDKL